MGHSRMRSALPLTWIFGVSRAYEKKRRLVLRRRRSCDGLFALGFTVAPECGPRVFTPRSSDEPVPKDRRSVADDDFEVAVLVDHLDGGSATSPGEVQVDRRIADREAVNVERAHPFGHL